MMNAPLVIFLYNRPDHASRCIEALQKNEGWNKTDVFVFCDGPKIPNEIAEAISKVHDIADNISGSKSLTVHKRESNIGLFQSVLEGVTSVCEKFGRAIVVEDDVVTSPGFLSFMNEALEKYEDSNVACISGYVFPLQVHFEKAFFVRGADCWGWGTWQRQWKSLDVNAAGLLSRITTDSQAEKDFTFNNSYPYVDMLRDRRDGKNQSWAILWYASTFLENKLCLYPSHSLVTNIGNDGSGTHTLQPVGRFDTRSELNRRILLPDEIAESTEARRSFEDFFRSLGSSGRRLNLINSMKALVRKILRLFKQPVSSQWSGNYATWDEASSKSSGYNSEAIFDKVRSALLSVKRGEAQFERDSVLLEKAEYPERILTFFRNVSGENNSLQVVDFGGSLGSSYFLYRNLLPEVADINWSIVEQRHFVDEGKRHFEDDSMTFYYNLEDAASANGTSVLLLSGVVQYLEDPYRFIDEVMKLGFQHIVVDRTAFIKKRNEIITIQNVPESIYEASYPAWFLNERKFTNAFERKYSRISEFDSEISLPSVVNNKRVYWKGFIFVRNNA